MARRRRRYSNKRRTRTYNKRPNRRLRSPLMNTILSNGFVQSRRTYGNTYTTKRKSNQTTKTHVSITTETQPYKNVRPLPSPARDQKKFARAIICARRQQRKEILHALKRTGQSGQKRPTRNTHRNIKC